MQTILETRLEALGLHLRGCLKVTNDELESYQLDVDTGAMLALVGNLGSSYWSVFVQSPEYQDEQAHPLDRWSRRIGDQLADELGARVIYPFDGPPFYPFQQWAKRAESLQQSQMGLMIHPEYGLWHSYRFGLLLDASQDLSGQNAKEEISPCKSCVARPCLNTCPVGAFGDNGYEVDTCSAYLTKTPEARCHTEGCIARSSCPVGREYRYNVEEHRFHLSAFLASR